MSDQNPYSAPDAALDTGQETHYQPKLLSFSGRIGRLRYLAYSFGLNFLLMFVVFFATALLGAMGGSGSGLEAVSIGLMGVFYIAAMVLMIGFARRRFNDLDKSGWWVLTFLIPLINLLASIYLVFFPGSDGPNRFGPAPAANSLAVVIVGWAIPVLFVLGFVAALAIPQFAGMAPVG